MLTGGHTSTTKRIVESRGNYMINSSGNRGTVNS
jgi:hypothetical protein